jgi:hypothetical protein
VRGFSSDLKNIFPPQSLKTLRTAIVFGRWKKRETMGSVRSVRIQVFCLLGLFTLGRPKPFEVTKNLFRVKNGKAPFY